MCLWPFVSDQYSDRTLIKIKIEYFDEWAHSFFFPYIKIFNKLGIWCLSYGDKIYLTLIFKFVLIKFIVWKCSISDSISVQTVTWPSNSWLQQWVIGMILKYVLLAAWILIFWRLKGSTLNSIRKLPAALFDSEWNSDEICSHFCQITCYIRTRSYTWQILLKEE